VERRRAPVALGRTGVPGFVGLADRGPVNTPVKLTSIPQFQNIFGEMKDGFLLPAVEGFFRNGGQECWVVRIAHRVGRSFGDPAERASCILEDGSGNGVIRILAGSEGDWGNRVSVSVTRQRPRAQTFLTLDGNVGDGEVTLRSTHGFRPGTLVRMFHEGGQETRYIRSVEGKRITWSSEAPLRIAMPASAPTYVEPVEFEMLIHAPFHREVFSDLSLHPASLSFVERVVADRSRLVSVRVLRLPGGADFSGLPDIVDIPVSVDGKVLSGGEDGRDNVTPDDFVGMSSGFGDRAGLAAFETVEAVDLLAAPDVLWLYERNRGVEGRPFSTLKDVEVVHDALISQCERLCDRFTLLDTPFPEDAHRTREYRLNFDSRFAALYFPWILVNRRGSRLRVPPCGHVAGVVARCDETTGVHRPPANEALAEVEDLTVLLRDDDVGALNGEGINCLKACGTRGLRIWGARTVSSDPPYRYLNVRRVLNTINKAMNQNLQWVVFEPNLPSVWKTVDRNVTTFLMDLWRKGWFQGETPEEAFYVKCDEETNPPEERDAGRMTIEIGVAPVRPAEFLTLRLAQDMQGGSEGS
jgi:hypothetical protein